MVSTRFVSFMLAGMVAILGFDVAGSAAEPSRFQIMLHDSNLWGMKVKTIESEGVRTNYLHVSYMNTQGRSVVVDIFLANSAIGLDFAQSFKTEIQLGSFARFNCEQAAQGGRTYCTLPDVRRPKKIKWTGPGRFIVPPLKTEAFHYVLEF